ncbi:MAG: hypothetical protein ACXWIU_12195 [Limisphaerales bacterium]
MNSAQTIPTQKPIATPAKSPDAARYFYSGAALLLLIMMFIGFKSYYLHGKAFPSREIAPPMRNLLLVHGTVMTTWMALFAVQPLLVARGNRKLHMTLGKFGAVLAIALVAVGFFVAILSAKFTPAEVRIWGLPPKNFMAIPVFSITSFAVYCAIGIWSRKKPQIHRPMMFMAVLAMVGAAVARIAFLNSLYEGTILETIFGPTFMTIVFGLIAFIVKSAVTRSFDRYYAIGFAVFTAVFTFCWAIAPTNGWLNIANALTR